MLIQLPAPIACSVPLVSGKRLLIIREYTSIDILYNYSNKFLFMQEKREIYIRFPSFPVFSR